MSKTLAGQLDLTGETYGSLTVLRPVRTRPQISYEVRCRDCSSTFAGITNQELKHNPKCHNANCGKRTFRSWREEHEYEQEETLRQAEEQYKKTSNELARVTRDYVLRADRDDEFMLCPETREQKFTPTIPTFAAAIDFTKAEAEAFVRENPGYWPCNDNMKTLCDYLIRNGADTMVSRDDFQRAYFRLREVGAIIDRPAPPLPPEPEPVSEPVVKKPVNTKPLMIRGIDHETGLAKDFTERQVNAMSSEIYRKTFMSTAEGLSRPALDLIPLLNGRLRA